VSGESILVPSSTGYVVLQGGRAPLPQHAGAVLLAHARAAIAGELGLAPGEQQDEPWLDDQGACFITLTQAGKLRGCIGTLRSHRPLRVDVRMNAVGAAFRDPRFKPLSTVEFPAVAVEVSLLTALEPIAFTDEASALAQLRAGIDGLVFEYGHHTSTFLPQVWDSFPDPAEFLAHLKYKSGLPPDFWDPAVKLSRYGVTKWREQRE